MALLETKGLTKDFGALRAVNNVNLEIKEGELHSLIGPNGAGKTTLFNVISGQLNPTSGRVLFKGKDITNIEAYKIPHLGIGRSFQITNVFPGLEVLENVRIVVQSRSDAKFNFFKKALNLTEAIDKSYIILEKVGLKEKAKWKASQLSHGEQRLLDMALALAISQFILLLDEPTSGLSPEETAEMVRIIKDISKEVSILLIEHKMHVVMNVSDRITVLNQGRVIAQGIPNEVRANEEVQRAYLGVR